MYPPVLHDGTLGQLEVRFDGGSFLKGEKRKRLLVEKDVIFLNSSLLEQGDEFGLDGVVALFIRLGTTWFEFHSEGFNFRCWYHSLWRLSVK